MITMYDILKTILLISLISVISVLVIIATICSYINYRLNKKKMRILEHNGYTKIPITKTRYKYVKENCDDIYYFDIDTMSLNEIKELVE